MRLAVIAATDLRRRVRNRSAVIVAFVAPLAIAATFGLLIGGTEDVTFSFGLVDADGSTTSEGIVEGLADGLADTPIDLTMLEDEGAARAAVDDGDLDVAVVLPSGLEAAAVGGEGVDVVVLQRPDRAISASVGASIAGSVASGFARADLAVAVAAELGVPLSGDLVEAASSAAPPVAIEDGRVGRGDLDATAYYGASMSMLFLFFTVGFATRSLLAERTEGTLDRVLSTPTAPATLIGGKVLSVSVLALGGFLTTWAVTSVVFGASWGPPATVAVLIVVTTASIAGVALFIAGFARTPQQADSYTSVVAFALALLGGNFVGPGLGPEVLQQLQVLTPNGWSLRAFTDAAADRASIGDVGLAVGVLVVIGVVFGAIGLLRIHRTVAA